MADKKKLDLTDEQMDKSHKQAPQAEAKDVNLGDDNGGEELEERVAPVIVT